MLSCFVATDSLLSVVTGSAGVHREAVEGVAAFLPVLGGGRDSRTSLRVQTFPGNQSTGTVSTFVVSLQWNDIAHCRGST